MPPIRTLPAATAAAKPVKTERSHEENQERAYIAASRRSDRSLEARVESARRASEIHKRRTGRSLRVTEQDVVNEEMYEEEDDDLPLQYRRLTSHYNTSACDFNRRLASYLTNHVAMRTALDQALARSYAQSGQMFNTNVGSPQQTQNAWMQNQNISEQQFQQSPMMIQPNMMHHSPTRHAPYPTPSGNGNANGMSMAPGRPRPGSVTTMQQPGPTTSASGSVLTSPVANISLDQERTTSSPTSLTQNDSTVGAVGPGHPSGQNSNELGLGTPSSSAHDQSGINSPAFAMFPDADILAEVQQEIEGQQYANPFTAPIARHSTWPGSPLITSPMSPPFSGLSTSLPPNVQTFLNPGFHMGQDQQPFYNYNPNIANQKPAGSSAFKGMSQTLAPEAFKSNLEQTSWPTPNSMSSDDMYSPLTAVGNAKFGADSQASSIFPGTPGILTDGQATPDEFANMINWDNDAPA